jgi:hypothetical protein
MDGSFFFAGRVSMILNAMRLVVDFSFCSRILFLGHLWNAGRAQAAAACFEKGHCYAVP